MAEEVNMDDINQVWDRILHIKTTGRDDSISDFTRYPYEPTDYPVLARLCERGYIGKNNTLVDYGCGKGRVDFFVAFHTKCHAIGIECMNGHCRTESRPFQEIERNLFWEMLWIF